MFKISDALILGSAFLSFAFSISLWFGFLGAPDKEAGNFVGIWVPSIIALGIYFKMKLRK